MGADALASFSEATLYNVIIQFAFRFSTFFLNAILLRYVTKDMLGVVNVRLMLLYTTIAFCVREPFRKACLSATPDSRQKTVWPAVINVLWLCPVVCVAVSIPLISIWVLWLEPPSAASGVTHYEWGVVMFAVAALIETLAEPFWILGQQHHYVRFKAVAEATQTFSRNVLFLITTLTFPKFSTLNFGFSMVFSSLLYASMYWMYFSRLIERKRSASKVTLPVFPFTRFSQMLPSTEHGFDRSKIALTISFWKLCIIKQLLTEGERFVMSFTGVLSFADQGLYDVVNNLGSLIARLVFAPIEESAYTFFSLTLSRGRSPLSEGGGGGGDVEKSEQDNFQLATQTFNALLKAISIMGALILCFGPPYAFLALQMYGGNILVSGEGPRILRWYCVYVVFLAVNGITECFLFATMENEQVNRHQRRLFGFCATFLVSAYFLTLYYGSIGFILANCVNMSVRIAYSCAYVRAFYAERHRDNPLWSLLPSFFLIAILCVAAATLFLSQALFCCNGFFNCAAHVAVGVIFALITLGTIYNHEIELVNFVWIKIIKPKFSSKKS